MMTNFCQQRYRDRNATDKHANGAFINIIVNNNIYYLGVMGTRLWTLRGGA